MSVAPPPAIYTATNDLNILKNIFVPQYQFNGAYFQASVNTNLPGNVTVGNAGTTYQMILNNRLVMTLSDLQDWARWKADLSVNINSNGIFGVSNIKFLGSNPAVNYTIDATAGSINVSQYWLKNTALTLSGGLPAWSAYPAVSNINLRGYTVSGASLITFASGAVIRTPASNTLAFSNTTGESMRITPSGLMVGTTSQLPGYSLTVSGGSLFTAPVLFGTQSGGNLDTVSNSFRINTVLTTLSTYDVYLQSLGVNTNLIIGTGGTGTSRVQIDPVGNVTLLTGNLTTPTASSNSIGGVILSNRNIVSNLSLSFVTSGNAVVLTVQNQSTTFILTPSVTGTIAVVQAPSSLAASNIGASWTIKNASLGATTNALLSFTNGTILNSSTTGAISLPGNALVTLVYSGTSSNYYIL